jgi:hypothetical protein
MVSPKGLNSRRILTGDRGVRPGGMIRMAKALAPTMTVLAAWKALKKLGVQKDYASWVTARKTRRAGSR